MGRVSLVFWTAVLFLVPLWAAIAAGSAVEDRTETWLGWAAGVAVFWVVASVAAFFYRRVRGRSALPSPHDIDKYYESHHKRVVSTALTTSRMEGVDPDIAILEAHALLPPIGEIRMAGYKEYYKALNSAAWNYSKAVKAAKKRKATRQEREDLALDALNRYAVIAEQRGDPWLQKQIDEILTNYIQR